MSGSPVHSRMNRILRRARKRHSSELLGKPSTILPNTPRPHTSNLVLEVGPSDVTLLVADDGSGFDPRASHPGHFGLQLMCEQAMAVGAALELASARPRDSGSRARRTTAPMIMDDVERLIQAFSARVSTSSTASKLDVLMDLERLCDGRAASFLLQVLGDTGEPSELRMHVLKRLRNGPLTANERSSVAGALGELMLHGCSIDLRMQAALALGEFTDISGVPTALGSLALESQELLDLRYSAFTSLERAGHTPECVNLLRQLSDDEMLGRSAQSALTRWHLDPRE